MDLCNKVLSKAPISWADVQKQLLTTIQTRGSSGGISTLSSNSSSSMLPINRLFVKQCSDFLIKHIKSELKYYYYYFFFINS
jgi:hypothetical protein